MRNLCEDIITYWLCHTILRRSSETCLWMCVQDSTFERTFAQNFTDYMRLTFQTFTDPFERILYQSFSIPSGIWNWISTGENFFLSSLQTFSSDSTTDDDQLPHNAMNREKTQTIETCQWFVICEENSLFFIIFSCGRQFPPILNLFDDQPFHILLINIVNHHLSN